MVNRYEKESWLLLMFSDFRPSWRRRQSTQKITNPIAEELS